MNLGVQNLAIGPFPDFDACVTHMMKPKEEGGGGYDENTARKVCGKMKAELEESFSWAGDLKSYPGSKLIRGEAIHPVKTFHPLEWPQIRVFLEDELKKSAETLVGKPLFLDHWRPLEGKVLGARYEDGSLEYVAELNDEDILRMIREDQIKHASVQFEWKSLEHVNGVAPRGINYQHLSLLKDMLPGDSRSTVEIWESIARQLKEAKGLTPPNPKGSETEKTKMNEKEFRESLKRYPDYTRVKYLKLLEAIVPLEQFAKLLEAEWDTDYINALNDNCFAYIEPGGEKDEEGKTTPRSLRHFPYKNAQGNLSPDHVRNGLARLGQELGDWATADAKAQIKKKLCAAAKELEIESEVCGLQEQADEPEKDEHGCIIDKERWDPDQEKCVAIAAEQQDEEPEKDEHGCVIGKEQWDAENEKCVPITAEARIAFLEASLKLKEQDELTEEEIKQKIADLIAQRDALYKQVEELAEEERAEIQKQIDVLYAEIEAYTQALAAKIAGQAAPPETPPARPETAGEAIIPPTTPKPPALIIPVEKLEAVLPSLQAERSMSWGTQRFVQEVKQLIREAKKGGADSG